MYQSYRSLMITIRIDSAHFIQIQTLNEWLTDAKTLPYISEIQKNFSVKKSV